MTRLTDDCNLKVSFGADITDGTRLTLYRSEEDGKWYARPTWEFNDQFEHLGVQ